MTWHDQTINWLVQNLIEMKQTKRKFLKIQKNQQKENTNLVKQ